jgi:hypothetical protein
VEDVTALLTRNDLTEEQAEEIVPELERISEAFEADLWHAAQAFVIALNQSRTRSWNGKTSLAAELDKLVGMCE